MRGWPITASWRILKMQGRAFVAPEVVPFFSFLLLLAAGSRGKKIKLTKKQNKKKPQPDCFQRQAATGLIQLWSIMWFPCSVNGCGIVLAAKKKERNETNFFFLHTNSGQRLADEDTEATNDQ